ncbi:MAG: acyl-CoA thioesterase II [Hyphomicrobiales bacterium]|nr:acyl-CoA thioesterase II [Hyphomicrobiales bacterium]
MAAAVEKLLAILDLEQLEHNLFRGRSPQDGWQRVFGGQVIGQALVAAERTVEGRVAHSLHAYFMRPGDPSVPIIYEVDRIRDGRSFNTRRVVAIQHGAAIFSMSVSFHIEEEGFDHQFDMDDVPDPEDLPSLSELKKDRIKHFPNVIKTYFERERPIEIRPVDLTRFLEPERREPVQHVWMRAAGTLPDDPALHQAALSYASDFTLLDTALIAHGRVLYDPTLMLASLDHAMWFHRPFRADEWMLYTQDSPATHGARGFCRGSIYTRDGVLVASAAQEGLVREKRDE